MKPLWLAASILCAVTSLVAAEQTWDDVAIVDVQCSAKVKADPGSHTRACALQCQAGGFGVLTVEGEFLKFDDTGNAKALALLKSSRKADHLRVTVTGTREGNTLKVVSLALR
jgi:hypothetical protein